MLKQLFRGTVLTLAAAISLSSCTVGEPDTPSGDPSKLMLKSISAYGVKLIDFDYDNNNRITKISIGKDATYEFEYAAGNSSAVPSEIIMKEYEDMSYDDHAKYFLTEEEHWTNIRANASGYITSCDVSTKYISYDRTWDENDKEVITVSDETYETGNDSWAYDSEGHLIKNYGYSTNQFGQTVYDAVDYNWTNGDLISFSDNDSGSHNESGTFTYSEVENTVGQWDPNNNVVGPLGVTGLFGKAPKHFFASETIMYGDYINEQYQYAYTLLDNGLINMANIYDGSENESLVYKFIYVKAK